MKKMIAFMLCILLLMSAALAVAEEAKPLAGKKLTIALSPNFMFFETVSETEECGYEGLDIDIIKELSNMLGFEFEIVPMSFSSLVGSLQAKSVDMVISGMSYTEERAQIVDFSDVYCTSVVGCVTKVDSEIASFDDLKNQIVCCSQGTNYEMIIEGIEGATLKTYQGQAAVGSASGINHQGTPCFHTGAVGVAEQRDRAAPFPGRAVQLVIGAFHPVMVSVGHEHLGAAQGHHLRVRHVAGAKVAVAPHTAQQRMLIPCADEVFQPGKVARPVAAVQIGLHRAEGFPCLLQQPADRRLLPVGVAEDDYSHAPCTSFMISSIFSQARARWLTRFFSSSVSSAKVLPRGS